MQPSSGSRPRGRALRRVLGLALAAALGCSTAALARPRSAAQEAGTAKALAAHPGIAAAFAHVDGERDAILREWSAITEINAPSGRERERAEFVERLLRGYKLDQVSYDSAGNLIAVRKGTGGAPSVVIDAHLDTVFQEGLKIKAEVRDGKIYAPGVGDDTRNIEAILASIRALDHAKVRTKGDLVFLFTVEEETTLGGAEHYLRENKDKIGHYVALDGGYEWFTYSGIGINWYRHHVVGPGGHTRSATPPYSATLPMARAISRIYELKLPEGATTHVNVGMVGGSEVPNAKAADAWFTVDLRSTSNEVMADMERQIAAILKEEADRVSMAVKTEVVSTMPAARIPGHENSPIVRVAEDVHLAMGFTRPPAPLSSANNSNAALLAGVSSISTGTAPCGDAHALTEWCEIEPFYKGIKKLILLEVALAQLAE